MSVFASFGTWTPTCQDLASSLRHMCRNGAPVSQLVARLFTSLMCALMYFHCF